MPNNKDKKIKIAWLGKHFGEEPPLIGKKNQGAGGIFFTGCNLHCLFCQNYQISQQRLYRKECSPAELAKMMLDLQKRGAVNIDLVSPTIWFQQLKEAITLAKRKGLKIPIVWNSNGYEAKAVIKEMKGLVDIYLPDFKYGADEVAFKYSQAKNYIAIAKKAIETMLEQVGYLKIKNGLAEKGLIVRHLVLPNNIENSLQALDILAAIDNRIHISLLNQYFPVYRAKEYPELNRTVSDKEFAQVCDYAVKLGFANGWVQTGESSQTFLPNFKEENPFA